LFIIPMVVFFGAKKKAQRRNVRKQRKPVIDCNEKQSKTPGTETNGHKWII